MGHITKKTTYFDIDIDSTSKNILIIQKWKYEWVSNGFPSWTYEEKQKIHRSFEKVIDSAWNNKAKIKINGDSSYAKLHDKDVYSITFDTQWITTNPFHFKVEAIKVSPKDYHNRPNVRWGERRIQLYSVDAEPMSKVGAPIGVRQKNVAHEFGHSIGNHFQIPKMHSDEYNKTSSFYEDKNSIMNVGMQLRSRHFDYLLQELNTIIPNTRFTVTL